MTFGYRLSAASLDVLVNSTSSSPSDWIRFTAPWRAAWSRSAMSDDLCATVTIRT
jgi:hypothetical protein